MTSPVAHQDDPAMLVVRAVVYHELLTEIEKRKSAAKSALSQYISRGSRLAGHDPRTGVVLGSVTKSDPDPVARVIDPEAFEAWVRERYHDQLERHLVFGDSAEVAAVLVEHAPHLVTEEVTIPAAVITAALRTARHQDVPGTVRKPGTATLSVTVKPAVRQVIQELLAAAPPALALEL
ncbi:hypothetical protein NDR87_30105 [Nocardia sp. CDC159]|uniref:Uncharacterized protein n=1 Tax=Nocardia pulmonis TaxID=2951408 RepID=A0A9X2J277_9NOCA|nr:MULTISPECIES: hypothetical protein [Nocardia]MCM6777746.1 hypothetical protein [Nocardia pulmonis]MCM6790631.1 hypothetical protein [Nocardia sp. CDC159]